MAEHPIGGTGFIWTGLETREGGGDCSGRRAPHARLALFRRRLPSDFHCFGRRSAATIVASPRPLPPASSCLSPRSASFFSSAPSAFWCVCYHRHFVLWLLLSTDASLPLALIRERRWRKRHCHGRQLTEDNQAGWHGGSSANNNNNVYDNLCRTATPGHTVVRRAFLYNII